MIQMLSNPDPEVLADAWYGFYCINQATQATHKNVACSWSLSYISDGPNEHIQAVIEHGCIPRLVQLLQSPDNSIVTPAVRTLGTCGNCSKPTS
jgi:hypothetical protein